MNFITIQERTVEEFREQNQNPLKFTAIILTSKFAVDNFFRITKELRLELPPEMKYLCVNEMTSKYLQKYIIIRKRKLYIGKGTLAQLFPIIQKHTKERYLYPCSEGHSNTELSEFMEQKGYYFREVFVYQTIPEDLSDIKKSKFDMICFFSPTAIDALFTSIPKYKQKETVIATFGIQTTKYAEEMGLRIDIQAPSPEFPSLTSAIDAFLKENKKK